MLRKALDKTSLVHHPVTTMSLTGVTLVITLVIAFVCWEAYDHTMLDICKRHPRVAERNGVDKDSDGQLARLPRCDPAPDNLPELSAGNVLYPEKYVYSAGMTIAGLGGALAYYFHHRAMTRLLALLENLPRDPVSKSPTFHEADSDASLRWWQCWCCWYGERWTHGRLHRLNTWAWRWAAWALFGFFVQTYFNMGSVRYVHGVFAFFFFSGMGAHAVLTSAVHRGAYCVALSAGGSEQATSAHPILGRENVYRLKWRLYVLGGGTALFVVTFGALYMALDERTYTMHFRATAEYGYCLLMALNCFALIGDMRAYYPYETDVIVTLQSGDTKADDTDKVHKIDVSPSDEQN